MTKEQAELQREFLLSYFDNEVYGPITIKTAAGCSALAELYDQEMIYENSAGEIHLTDRGFYVAELLEALS